jgi:hypothetical protein
VPTSHFSKAGISLNSIWRPIFKNPQKRGPIPKKPNETGNFRGNGRPKKNHENGGQKQGQNLPINPPMILPMNGPLSGQIFCQTTSGGEAPSRRSILKFPCFKISNNSSSGKAVE